MAYKEAVYSNKELREFHQLGEYVIQFTSGGGLEEGSFSELCLLTNKNANELAKARQFARLYNDRKLKWLCSLGQKVGRPLTKSHICRLVVVRDGKQRDRLAQECAEESWSVERLGREIRKIQPKAG